MCRYNLNLYSGTTITVNSETILYSGTSTAATNANVLMLGFTFKENCPDLRNTKVVDIVKALQSYNTKVDVFDPWINLAEADAEYGLKCLSQLPEDGQYSAIVLAVGHLQFVELGEVGIKACSKANSVLFDVKGVLNEKADGRL